ncbi:MAG TPA: hypothetical protein VK790_14955 [Solirubrobacteraceae bacterium]|nr:hypothetical protein [Solirubrobacteraceae bacterium]
MSHRSRVASLACFTALGALSAPGGASAAHSVGSREQVEWVRRAATNFVTAELAGNGAGACGILDASLRGTEHHRTCAQRWDARLASLLRAPGGRARLRAQKHAIATSAVIVRGYDATIELPTPLLDSSNRFVWSENCWMLDR